MSDANSQKKTTVESKRMCRNGTSAYSASPLTTPAGSSVPNMEPSWDSRVSICLAVLGLVPKWMQRMWRPGTKPGGDALNDRWYRDCGVGIAGCYESRLEMHLGYCEWPKD